MKLYYRTTPSPVGTLVIGATDQGLCALRFLTDDRKAVEEATAIQRSLKLTEIIHAPDHSLLKEVARQLDEYWQGTRTTFDAPLHLIGTPFRQSVWAHLQTIEFGHLQTYGEVAAALGNPNKSRACGGAIGSNPIPIIVPCHRVVGATGALTGFSAPGGTALKTKFLQHEGMTVFEDRVKK